MISLKMTTEMSGHLFIYIYVTLFMFPRLTCILVTMMFRFYERLPAVFHHVIAIDRLTQMALRYLRVSIATPHHPITLLTVYRPGSSSPTPTAQFFEELLTHFEDHRYTEFSTHHPR